MILVDSSVWIDHFAKPDHDLSHFLSSRQIATHAFIVGEISLGSLADRAGTLRNLNELPRLSTATTAEVAALIEWAKLFGTGLSYIDAHLIAAARLHGDVPIWTRDKRLKAQADRLGLALYG